MSDQLQNLEYSTEEHNGVLTRRSATCVVISLRYRAGKILLRLFGPFFLLCLTAGSFYFLFLLPFRAGAGGVGGLIAPAFFFAITLVQLVVNLVPMFFPVTVEVYADQLVIKWRTLMELRTESWRRNTIKNIWVRRLRIQNTGYKRWYLALDSLERGTVAIMHATPSQLEIVATGIREAWGMKTDAHPAMSIKKPDGCRYQCIEWRGGVALIIPDRRLRVLKICLVVLSILAAGIIYFILGQLKGWDDMHSLVSVGPILFLSILAGALVSIGLWQGFIKLLRRTEVIVTPVGVQAVQTGLLHPLNAGWTISGFKCAEITESVGGRCGIHLIPLSGLPLMVAQRERQQDVEWAIRIISEALSFARAATKTESTASAAPPPEHTAPTSSDHGSE